MKFAYADPPYLGCGAKHYAHQHADAADYDSLDAHAALIRRLVAEFPEAWAVSLSAPSLEAYLHLTREIVGKDAVRVAAWVKPFASFKPGVNPAYCWEPVLFFGGRSAAERGGRDVLTVRDYVSANITTERGTSGAKPSRFAFWVFDFLGANGGDDFHDLYPGSGAIWKAWNEFAWANPGRICQQCSHPMRDQSDDFCGDDCQRDFAQAGAA